MTETDLAASWGTWLTEQLASRDWRQADLVRESHGLIKRDRASNWVNTGSGRTLWITPDGNPVVWINPAKTLWLIPV